MLSNRQDKFCSIIEMSRELGQSQEELIKDRVPLVTHLQLRSSMMRLLLYMLKKKFLGHPLLILNKRMRAGFKAPECPQQSLRDHINQLTHSFVYRQS